MSEDKNNEEDISDGLSDDTAGLPSDNESDNESGNNIAKQNNETEMSDSAFAKKQTRLRRAELANILEEMGFNSKQAVDSLYDIDKLFPDPISLTNGETLESRLIEGINALKKSRSSLYINTGLSLDSSNDIGKGFRSSKNMEKIINSEDELFIAYLVNDRLMSGLASRYNEHEAASVYFRNELVRRRSMAENWRYCIPKYLLPLLSGFNAAGITNQKFRNNSKLMNSIIDLLVEHSVARSDGNPGGNLVGVSREEIVQAMQQTEEQFTALLSSKDDPFGARDFGDIIENNVDQSSLNSKKLNLSPEEIEKYIKDEMNKTDIYEDEELSKSYRLTFNYAYIVVRYPTRDKLVICHYMIKDHINLCISKYDNFLKYLKDDAVLNDEQYIILREKRLMDNKFYSEIKEFDSEIYNVIDKIISEPDKPKHAEYILHAKLFDGYYKALDTYNPDDYADYYNSPLHKYE